jgi:hypothetical protein
MAKTNQYVSHIVSSSVPGDSMALMDAYMGNTKPIKSLRKKTTEQTFGPVD